MYNSLMLIGALLLAPCLDLALAQSSRRRPPQSTAPAPKRPVKKKPVAKAPAGVRAQFRKAQKLYNDRKFDDALLAYDRILRKYPAHQPSMIQMAKVFYRLDRIPEAHRLFTRINPIQLDIETSYEYALSHFWMRNYQQALYGFQRVPQGHPLFDLANYYGGISALKLRRLVEAESMMDKAVVLPAKLAKSRKNYQRHIQELKLIYEKKGLADERARERKRIEAIIRKEKPVRLAPKDHPNIKEEAGYEHNGFESVDTAPEVGVVFKNQLVDYHGFGEEETKLRIGFFQFEGGPLVPIPFKVGDDQAAIGLQLVIRAEEQEREGIERRNIQTDDLDDIQRILTSDPEQTYSKFGTLTVQPWVEIPTTLGIWVALGGKLFLRYPDFERESLTSSRSGYLRLGAKQGGREYSLKYEYAEVVDTEDELIQAIHTGLFEWDFDLTKDVAFDVELKHNFFEYNDNSIDGPTSATSLTGDLSDTLPFGFSLGVKGSAQYQSQYVTHDLDTFGDVEADGQTYTGKLYLNASPVDWFDLSASTVIQKTNWQVTPEEAQETYEKNTPDRQQEFIVEATLNLLF